MACLGGSNRDTSWSDGTPILMENLCQAARLDYCTSTKVGVLWKRPECLGEGVISDMCQRERERLDLSQQI